jgi:glycosyltransferase involved in cell wall biosynthesis
MACGAPVVATACHGPQEIVSSGVNGSLVPVGDELAFTRALVELLQDPGLRERYREAALRRANEYAVTRVGEQYLSLFRRLAASAR